MQILSEYIRNVVDSVLLEQQTRGMQGLLERLRAMNESRFDDAKKKYPQVAQEIELFKDLDPKYIMWIAKELRPGDINSKAMLQALRDLVTNFDKAVRLNKVAKKDINAYKDMQELDSALAGLDLTSNTEKVKKAKEAAKLIYKDERYTIIQPTDMHSSCYYGHGTKWCISATESQNMFDRYSSNGVVFYFIIDKQPEDSIHQKVALAVYPGGQKFEIFDALDDKMSGDEFAGLYPPQVLNVLNPFVQDQFKSAEDKANEMLAQLTSITDDRTFLRVIRDYVESIPSQERDAEDDDGNPNQSQFRGVMERLIQSLPLDKLTLMYDIGGFSLVNLGLLDDVVNRLKAENVSVDQLLGMITKTHQVFRLDRESYQFANPYLKYLETKPLSMEEMGKLLSYSPPGKDWDYAPYGGPAEYQFIAQIGQRLGLQIIGPDGQYTDLFKGLRNFARSSDYRAAIRRIVAANQSGKPGAIERAEADFYSRWSTESEVVEALASLVQQGKIDDHLLDPLLGPAQ